MVEKLASAVYNNVVAGLVGITSNPTISLDQLYDDIIDERLQIIKEYSAKNLVPIKDLIMSVNCIDIDCKSLDKCPCNGKTYSPAIAHFEMPQIVNDLALDAIEFIGSIDRSVQFRVYTNTSFTYQQYARRGATSPFVYIETTPNDNNMYDVWVYNAPLLKKISIIAIFKDPRQLDQYDCCKGDDIENYSFISTEIKKRLTEKYLRYFRQMYQSPSPNNQVAK